MNPSNVLYYATMTSQQALDTRSSVISNDRTLIPTKDKTIEVADRSHSKNCVNALVNKRVMSFTRQRLARLRNPAARFKRNDLYNRFQQFTRRMESNAL